MMRGVGRGRAPSPALAVDPDGRLRIPAELARRIRLVVLDVDGVLMMTRLGLDWPQVAMMGDDLPDLPVLKKVGLPVAVANAVREVRAQAVWTARREGGRGAVREFTRVLLESRGEWEDRVAAYLEARAGDAPHPGSTPS
jgi:3-deoxy-D-manno-octulosonate 8-phosphate phosphatase KdsC-like HAD superfamily phosphatase